MPGVRLYSGCDASLTLLRGPCADASGG